MSRIQHFHCQELFFKLETDPDPHYESEKLLRPGGSKWSPWRVFRPVVVADFHLFDENQDTDPN
jgi:hypothetical protein